MVSTSHRATGGAEVPATPAKGSSRSPAGWLGPIQKRKRTSITKPRTQLLIRLLADWLGSSIKKRKRTTTRKPRTLLSQDGGGFDVDMLSSVLGLDPSPEQAGKDEPLEAQSNAAAAPVDDEPAAALAPVDHGPAVVNNLGPPTPDKDEILLDRRMKSGVEGVNLAPPSSEQPTTAGPSSPPAQSAKGGSKTPKKKKIKKKKLRARVVLEARPARTPKPVTPKQAKEKTAKRPYAKRKKKDADPKNTEAATSNSCEQSGRKISAKRKLNFVHTDACELPTVVMDSKMQDQDTNMDIDTLGCPSTKFSEEVKLTDSSNLEEQVGLAESKTLPSFAYRRDSIRENMKRHAEIRDMKHEDCYEPQRSLEHLEMLNEEHRNQNDINFVHFAGLMPKKRPDLPIRVHSLAFMIAMQRNPSKSYLGESEICLKALLSDEDLKRKSKKHKRHQSLVPYDGGRMMVPYKRLSRVTKKLFTVDMSLQVYSAGKQPRWEEAHDKANGSDNDPEKWKEEREIFKGRIDAFISTLSWFQGDRRFSPWKGSVVDSVIGVFLTQNVADYLSSSAFMNLAATFPLHPKEQSEVDVKLESKIPTQCYFVTHEDEHNEERERPRGSISHQTDKSGDSAEGILSSEGAKAKDLEEVVPSPNRVGLTTRPPGYLIQEESQTGLLRPELNPEVHMSNKDMNHGRDRLPSILPERTRDTLKPKVIKSRTYDWESLRKLAIQKDIGIERNIDRADSADWEAARIAGAGEIAEAIKDRGMQNNLAKNIKNFLDRLVKDHGSIDLEWLRNVEENKTKEYLLSILGLGLKSTECIRLLSLNQVAFPVDTNVARICVRLGWVKLQPLPEFAQLRDITLYPYLDSIQKYLWPRLRTLTQEKLYELHYHMITFGKVFCTKTRPNCNECPMKRECKYYASECAGLLPEPEERNSTLLLSANMKKNSDLGFGPIPISQLEGSSFGQGTTSSNYGPIIEEPDALYTECPEELSEMEDSFVDSNGYLHFELKNNALDNQYYGDKDSLKAITNIGFGPIPMPKLKNVIRLRTEHQVYELPDIHYLLKRVDERDPDDQCPYLLAIWTPGETSESTQTPKTCCMPQGKECENKTCFSCNNIQEEAAQVVKGTLLIPCRTANRGRFPLNGTYFQTNEVFADHASSHNPLIVRRESIWNLPKRTLYCGAVVTSVFKAMKGQNTMDCFLKGYVCHRGFDRKTRRPMPLHPRLHISPSKPSPEKKSSS